MARRLEKYFFFLSLMLMITTFLPVLTNNMPAFIRSHHTWVIIWLGSLLIFRTRIFFTKCLIAALLYGIMVLLITLGVAWSGIDQWYISQIQNEYYQVFVGLTIITYFWEEKDINGLSKLVRWTFLAIIITSVMTIITSVYEPLYTRLLTGMAEIHSKTMIDYTLSFKKYGAGGYGFAAVLMSLLPLIIYVFKYHNLRQLPNSMLYAVLSIITLTIINMQIFANILIAFIVLFFSFTGSGKPRRTILGIVFVVLLSSQISTHTYINTLYSIASILPEKTDISYKLNNLGNYIHYGSQTDNPFSLRGERYPMLIDAFISNPFLGHHYSDNANDISEGAHLHWMSKLAVYGIIGTLPFIYLLVIFIKNAYTRASENYKFYFLLAVLSIFLLGIFKTLAGRDMWYTFFVLLPGFNYILTVKSSGDNRRSSNNPSNSRYNFRNNI